MFDELRRRRKAQLASPADDDVIHQVDAVWPRDRTRASPATDIGLKSRRGERCQRTCIRIEHAQYRFQLGHSRRRQM